MKEAVAQSLYTELFGAIDAVWSSELFVSMGSEIERAFAAAMVVGLRMSDVGKLDVCSYPPREESGALFFLCPQVEIGPYRVDFILGGYRDHGGLLRCVAIECDGHAWHEKTKEQAARDKQRDRYLSNHVGRVIHFTGSEIYVDASRCCSEAGQALLTASFGGRR